MSRAGAKAWACIAGCSHSGRQHPCQCMLSMHARTSQACGREQFLTVVIIRAAAVVVIVCKSQEQAVTTQHASAGTHPPPVQVCQHDEGSAMPALLVLELDGIVPGS